MSKVSWGEGGGELDKVQSMSEVLEFFIASLRKSVANPVIIVVQFQEEILTNKLDKILPILDLQVSVDNMPNCVK